MSGLGLFIALTEEERVRLLAAPDEDARLTLVQRLEQRWDLERIQQTDKAWYPIHLALSGRRPLSDPDRDPATYPLDHVVMGGTSLYGKGDPDTDSWVLRLIEPNVVQDIARALPTITAAQMRALYDKAAALDDDDVQCGDEDFAFAMGWLEDVKAFFARQAATGRAIVFTADR